MQSILAEKIKSAIRDVYDYPKPGIIFKDITPVLADPVLMQSIVKALVTQYKPLAIDAIAAIEARGFILGSILAHELKCRFIPIRKAGKLPFKTRKQSYALEYGTAEIEIHEDAVQPGWRILIHDDLLATGGTAVAAGKLVESLQGVIAGFSFLVNLSFLPGEEKLTREFERKPNFLVEY